jgi:hypothetical protein
MKCHPYLLLLTAAVILAAGCSSDGPLPLAPAVGLPMGGPGLDSRSAVIGPQGGQLVNGDVRLDLPAGALDSPTRVGIERREDGSVEITPEGLEMRVPASLTFTLAPGSDPAVHQVEMLESAGAWVTLPSVVAGVARVAPVRNFSIYHIVEYE